MWAGARGFGVVDWLLLVAVLGLAQTIQKKNFAIYLMGW